MQMSEETGGQEVQLVWGLRVAKELKNQWLSLAALVEVPVGRLISYVLGDWFKANIAAFSTTEGKIKLAKLILSSQKANKGRAAISVYSPADDDTFKMRTNLSIRGVKLETRIRLKAMATITGVTVYKLLDTLVKKEWEEGIGKESVPYGVGKRIEKEVKKILYAQVDKNNKS